MKLTNYKYQDEDSLPHAIAEGYKEAEKWWGIPGAASGASQYAMHNKGKTVAVLGVILAASLTAAYFLSPAYATSVGESLAKAATLVSPAITAMSAFAVAHPLVASLIVVAAVAALIAAPILAYENSNKASQIEADQIEIIKKAVSREYNSEGDKEVVKTKFFEAVTSAVFGEQKHFQSK